MPTLKEDNYLKNPSCQPASATVLTPGGIKTIGDISKGDKIWSGEGFVSVSAKRSAGSHEVFSFKTTAGVLLASSDHKVMSDGVPVSAGAATSMDLCLGPGGSLSSHNPASVLDGLVLLHGNADEGGVHLLVQKRDGDSFFKERGMAGYFDNEPMMTGPDHYYVKTSIPEDALVDITDRKVPDSFFFASSTDKLCSFLRGIYSANGSVTGLKHNSPRIALKVTSPEVLEQVQVMLSSIGIASYFTFNPSKKVDFENGTYKTIPSYDLNIGASPSRDLFNKCIGFIQNYKKQRLSQAVSELSDKGPKKTYDLTEKSSLGKQPCFDLILDGANTYWTGGVLSCDGSV